jgi:hypothetical protein
LEGYSSEDLMPRYAFRVKEQFSKLHEARSIMFALWKASRGRIMQGSGVSHNDGNYEGDVDARVA